MSMEHLTSLQSWLELERHYEKISSIQMRDMFESDPARANRFSAECPELFLDFSKNRITDKTLELLVALASRTGVADQIHAQQGGRVVRDRRDLLAAVRAYAHGSDFEPLADVDGVALRTVNRLFDLMNKVFMGDFLGPTGKPIRDVVTIAPASTCTGLRFYASALSGVDPGRRMLRHHFLSAFGDARASEAAGEFDPETSLFIIVWHGAYEDEVSSNVADVLNWMSRLALSVSAVAPQFVVLSTSSDPCAELGIPTSNVFQILWHRADRFALWSLVGLTSISYLGVESFEALLSGAQAVDGHFLTAPLASNLPVILALLGIWYANFFHADTLAVFPYAKELAQLVPHIQQIHMVGAGHRLTQSGDVTTYETSPVVWGGTGTESQYIQMEILHRYARLVPSDFIAVVNPSGPRSDYGPKLFAECIAQSAKLMLGSTAEDLSSVLDAHALEPPDPRWRLAESAFPGNQPTNTILLDSLSAGSLGALLACYEHKIAVQQLVWRI